MGNSRLQQFQQRLKSNPCDVSHMYSNQIRISWEQKQFNLRTYKNDGQLSDLFLSLEIALSFTFSATCKVYTLKGQVPRTLADNHTLNTVFIQIDAHIRLVQNDRLETWPQIHHLRPPSNIVFLFTYVIIHSCSITHYVNTYRRIVQNYANWRNCYQGSITGLNKCGNQNTWGSECFRNLTKIHISSWPIKQYDFWLGQTVDIPQQMWTISFPTWAKFV